MLQKLENQPHMIVNDIGELYSDYWVMYGVTEAGSIHAMYLADTQDGLPSFTKEELKKEGFIERGYIKPKRLLRNNIEIGGIYEVLPRRDR
jgi:hypothetical protein